MRIYLEDMIAQDVLDLYGEGKITEVMMEAAHPLIGNGYYMYHIFYHTSPLIYFFDLRYYSGPLPSEQQRQLEVVALYVLLEDNVLIDQQGAYLNHNFADNVDVSSND